MLDPHPVTRDRQLGDVIEVTTPIVVLLLLVLTALATAAILILPFRDQRARVASWWQRGYGLRLRRFFRRPSVRLGTERLTANELTREFTEWQHTPDGQQDLAWARVQVSMPGKPIDPPTTED